jgi:arylsulfatase A-like enzyme
VDALRSVVLITVDCLRADHVGFNGYPRPTTPFLDSLAQEGIVFSNAIVTGSPTYYSFPGIMVSRHPLAFGRDVVGLVPGEPTIATEFKKAGYATGAFLAGNPYLSRRFGYAAGFDTFRDFLDAEFAPLGEATNSGGGARLPGRLNQKLKTMTHRLGPLGGLYDELYFRYCQRKTPPVASMKELQRFPAADAIVDEATSWLNTIGERPFFLWLHLMDPHAPYYPPEDALRLMGDETINPQRARYLNSYWNRGDLHPKRFAKYLPQIQELYDAGIRWVDKQVERLMETMERAKRRRNCIFALTADHGEQFLDHKDRYHAPTKLTEELIRVPLLLSVPGAGKGKTIREPFSLLHLGPTLLAAAGATVPQEFRGQSNWPKLQNGGGGPDAAIVECIAGCTNPYRASDRLGSRLLAVREGRYKLTLDFRSNQAQLFDLERDPDEQGPLLERNEKPVRRRLLEAARQHLANSQPTRDDAHRLNMRLRDLRLEWSM